MNHALKGSSLLKGKLVNKHKKQLYNFLLALEQYVEGILKELITAAQHS